MGCGAANVDEENAKRESELKDEKEKFNDNKKLNSKKKQNPDEEPEEELPDEEVLAAQTDKEKKTSKKDRKKRTLEKDFNKEMEDLRNLNPEDYVKNFRAFEEKYRDILKKQKIDLNELDLNIRNGYGANYIKKEIPIENKNVKDFILEVARIGLNLVKKNPRNLKKLDDIMTDFKEKLPPVQRGITYSLTKGFEQHFSIKTEHINNNLKFNEEMGNLELLNLVIYNELLESEKFFFEMATVITAQKELKTVVITIVPYEKDGEFHNDAIYEDAVFRYFPVLFNAIASHKLISTFYLSVFKNIDVRFSKSVMQSLSSIIKKPNLFALHLNKIPISDDIIEALDLSTFRYLGIAMFEPDMRVFYNLVKMIVSHNIIFLLIAIFSANSFKCSTSN